MVNQPHLKPVKKLQFMFELWSLLSCERSSLLVYEYKQLRCSVDMNFALQVKYLDYLAW